MAVTRYDAGTLLAPRKTPQGFLIVDGYASRVGVQDYRRSDGTVRRELRLPEHVFDSSSLDGFRGAPVTDDHPDDHVTPANARAAAGGTVLSAGRPEGGCVAVTMVIQDAALIAKMAAGKRQLSVGYTVDLDETPGDHPEFGRYDAVQKNIVPNHLAVVDAGRAGPVASARMDALDAIACEGRAGLDNGLAPGQHASSMPVSGAPKVDAAPAAPSAERKDATMTTEELQKKLGEALADVETQRAKKDAAKARADKAEADLKAATDKLAATEAERDNARRDAEANKVRADKAETDAKTRADEAKTSTDAAVAKALADGRADGEKVARDRLTVEAKADAILGAKDDKGAPVDRSKMTTREIKLAIAKHVDREDVPADKREDDSYIDAMYAGACKRQATGATALAGAREMVAADPAVQPKTPDRADADDEKAAAEKLRSRTAGAWSRKETK